MSDIIPSDPLQQAARMVQALARRCSARLVETHISWVLLDGTYAWKIKKPLKLPFLDFSTLKARQRLCEAECKLNRRLAPELYLDVQPITGSVDAPVFLGSGAVLDYAVRMRAFPDEALMSTCLAQGHLQGVHMERLANKLADFHAHAAVADAGSAWGAPERLIEVADGLLAGLAQQPCDAALLTRIRTWLAQQAVDLTPLWRERLRTGHVVEGHGDLHLANLLVLGDDVTAFDCIEFDPALRWIDALDDIAFVVMDLLAHKRQDLAYRFLNAYLDASGDHEGLPVLRYDVVCRALVRALVGGLPGAQNDAAGRPDYLALAGQLIEPQPTGLLLMHGLSGSGKSYQALQMAERAGAIRLRSDVERRRLPAWTDPAQRYGQQATHDTYARLLSLAQCALSAGYPVIVDATFLRQAERAPFRQLARQLGVPCHILHCEAPLTVLQQRIRTRREQGQDPSEADETVLMHQCQVQDPLTPDELAHTIDSEAMWPSSSQGT